MKIGDSSETTRIFTPQDLRDYAALSGHKGAVKSDRVPGPLIDVLISYILTEQLPGKGVKSLEQQTHYQPGAVVMEPLKAKVEITQLVPEEQLAELATTCSRADGKIIARGRVLVHIDNPVRKDSD